MMQAKSNCLPHPPVSQPNRVRTLLAKCSESKGLPCSLAQLLLLLPGSQPFAALLGSPLEGTGRHSMYMHASHRHTHGKVAERMPVFSRSLCLDVFLARVNGGKWSESSWCFELLVPAFV
uniref:Uncharacterized protein n=1 Tax=Ditylenchus dipsaci TaxID=166011 RepID=A0A915CKS1_9BILA